MKKITYKCDRCGCELGEDNAALEKMRFATIQRIRYQVKFFKEWKNGESNVIVRDLCEKCRSDLDKWLNQEE